MADADRHIPIQKLISNFLFTNMIRVCVSMQQMRKCVEPIYRAEIKLNAPPGSSQFDQNLKIHFNGFATSSVDYYRQCWQRDRGNTERMQECGRPVWEPHSIVSWISWLDRITARPNRRLPSGCNSRSDTNHQSTNNCAPTRETCQIDCKINENNAVSKNMTQTFNDKIQSIHCFVVWFAPQRASSRCMSDDDDKTTAICDEKTTTTKK